MKATHLLFALGLARRSFGSSLDLDTLMASINSFKDGKEDTCEACVAAGKEWCVTWDSCDVDECEDDDVILSNCTQLTNLEAKRPDLAPGVLVEVLLPEARQQLFVEGHNDTFWNQVRATDEFERFGLARPGNKSTVGRIDQDGASTITVHSDVRLAETSSSLPLPMVIGVIGRAYHSLDEYTVKDDAGFELKHRIRAGPEPSQESYGAGAEAFFAGTSVQEKEPVYFRKRQLRALLLARKGDRVRSRFYTRKGVMSRTAEDALVLNSTSTASFLLRFEGDGTEMTVPRTFVVEGTDKTKGENWQSIASQNSGESTSSSPGENMTTIAVEISAEHNIAGSASAGESGDLFPSACSSEQHCNAFGSPGNYAKLPIESKREWL
ncbi:unnamed protein product [Amoebophrya sp. A25]|nr:unnamed protein product [Amoebophrya sp. A25]|eukprot:GSA25T00011670001.1